VTSRYVQISLWSILWVCSLPVWANSELRQGDKGNYRQMGIMRLQRGDYGGAVQSFQKAIRQHPKEGSLYFELAVTLQRLGRFQESVAPLKRAIALEPDNNTDAYQLLGAACAMEEQWPEAVKALEIAATTSSPPVASLYALAFAYLKTGEENKAEQTVQRMFAEHGNSPELYLLLGAMHRDHGRLEESLEAENHALELNPRTSLAHYELGLTKAQMGNWQEAREEFLKEVGLHAEAFQAHLALAQYYLKFGPDPDAALLSLNQVLRLRPQSWQAYLYLGEAHLQKGETETAARSLERAVSLRPQEARTHNLLGSVYRKLGRTQAAQQEFEIATRLQNESRERAQSKILKDGLMSEPK